MEQKQTTPPYEPAWVEDMKKWQEENTEQRAVLCIATENGETTAALFGESLRLMVALLGAMNQQAEFANVCKGALTAKDNPIAALALFSALKDSEKNQDEKEEELSDPSTKELLKTILSKLADKL